MLGVPRELAEHTLNINPKFKSADETKMVDSVPGDSSKQFSISANLDLK